MNSYNENLNAVVVNSLQSQSLDEKAIYSRLNASIFTLYYAEGAAISAEEKLEASKKELVTKAKVKVQAVNNTNLSNNLLASATQTNQYFKQSINNMAVCAANVQVAANAIVRLASDIGSIFSIVHAADRNSDIYTDTEKVRKLIDETAYNAEVASKLAMETSAYTSEVSAPTVLDKAKSANLAINNLLNITSTDYNNVSVTVNQDNATLSTLSAKEKLAEGVLEDISIDFKATQKAYDSTNQALNLDLWISHVQDSLFYISFNKLKNPFSSGEIVDNYHIIFVKETKKATFSVACAEGIRINAKPHQYIRVKNSVKDPLGITLDLINFVSISEIADPDPSPVIDSDGDVLVLGKNYVVFVLAVFTDPYKREINNFDDFLSAPSREFLIANALTAVDGKTIKVEEVVKENKTEVDIKVEVDFKLGQQKTLKTGFDFSEEILDVSEYTHKLTFTTGNDPYKPVRRCIFLPANPRLDQRMLTTKSLKALLKESGKFVTDKERVADAFKAEIAKFEADLKEIDTKEKELKKTIARLTAQIKADPQDKDAKKWTAELANANHDLAHLEKEKTYFTDQLKKAKSDEKKMLEALNDEADEADLQFFFNLNVAEQVSASNYTNAIRLLKEDATPKAGAEASTVPPVTGNESWLAFVGPETTDNFGDFLIDGNLYYAVVLTLSADEIDNPFNYTNALSSIYPNCQFKFKANTSKN